MSVLTHFYRLTAEQLTTLEANPEFMDLLLGCSETTAYCEQNCFCSAPQLNIDKAWDEILIILCGTNNEAACRALDIALWEEFDGFEEIRLFSPAQVETGFEILKKVEIEDLRAEVLRRELRTFDGEPMEFSLDYALARFGLLRNFWREAAEAGDGIVSSTG